MSFENLPPILGETLVERGFTEVTPVQAAVTAPEVAGRDLIVSAQTGSGKTVAFGLALAPELLASFAEASHDQRPRALVVAPTRELALQVSRELAWLYGKTGLRIATCVGGMDASKERRALRGGPAIVVGTPGRLRDHLERGSLDLSKLAGIVLDEADEMLDMGFREDLEEILDASPESRRTLLFSATLPRPIVRLAERYQTDAVRLTLAGSSRAHGDIAYQAITVAPSEIENAVVNLLRFHEAETAICFCATRDSVRRLHATLQNRGFAVVALSGEHSQSERNQAMQALRDQRARVCVATDVAARGLDLPSLSLVIHVEIPRDAETLQHRSGRTGRAGRKGTAAIVVPYNRRKRVEGMLRGAQISAEWLAAPSSKAIREQDHVRLMEKLTQQVEYDDAGRKLANELMNRMTPEDTDGQLADMKFAVLTAVRSQYDEPHPTLRLGSIVAVGGLEDTDYRLCIQPVCDSVRIPDAEERSFPMLRMTVVPHVNKGHRVDVVVQTRADDKAESSFVKLCVSLKARHVSLLPIRPEAGRGVVSAGPPDDNGNRWFVPPGGSEPAVRWVADLKPEFAIRIAGRFAGEISRVGLTESEWLRRMAL